MSLFKCIASCDNKIQFSLKSASFDSALQDVLSSVVRVTDLIGLHEINLFHQEKVFCIYNERDSQVAHLLLNSIYDNIDIRYTDLPFLCKILYAVHIEDKFLLLKLLESHQNRKIEGLISIDFKDNFAPPDDNREYSFRVDGEFLSIDVGNVTRQTVSLQKFSDIARISFVIKYNEKYFKCKYENKNDK